MSTRSTIVYTKGLHIYHECSDDEICINFPETFEDFKKNVKYDDIILSIDDLIEIRDNLNKYIEKSYEQEK